MDGKVRSLTLEVGALRAELQQERQRSQRLVIRAKECETEAHESDCKRKTAAYVAKKLEEEAAAAKAGAQAAEAKSRQGLEAVRRRLAEVEASLAARTQEGQAHADAAHSALRNLHTLVLPLVAAAAAAAGSGGRARSAPLPRTNPEAINSSFSLAFGALAELSRGIGGAERPALALDSRRPAPAAMATLGAGTGSYDPEKEQLRAEAAALKGQLAAAQSRAAGEGPSAVAAVQQLEAVIPQYRAAAAALQGRASLLKSQLEAALPERDAAQEEAATWRRRASAAEAAHAGAAARLHSHEAAVASEAAAADDAARALQREVARLQACGGDGDRQLAAARQEASELRAAAAQREALLAAQAATVRQLEATIAEQQADIRSALDLVVGRGPTSSAAAAALGAPFSTPALDFGRGHPPPQAGKVHGWSQDPSPGRCEAAAHGQEDWLISASADSGGRGYGCGGRPGGAAEHHWQQQQQQQQQQPHAGSKPDPLPRWSEPSSQGAAGSDSLTAVKGEIQGLEEALRRALAELNV